MLWIALRNMSQACQKIEWAKKDAGCYWYSTLYLQCLHCGKVHKNKLNSKLSHLGHNSCLLLLLYSNGTDLNIHSVCTVLDTAGDHVSPLRAILGVSDQFNCFSLSVPPGWSAETWDKKAGPSRAILSVQKYPPPPTMVSHFVFVHHWPPKSSSLFLKTEEVFRAPDICTS